MLLPPKDLGPVYFFSLVTGQWGLARAISAGTRQPVSWECGERERRVRGAGRGGGGRLGGGAGPSSGSLVS